MVADTFIGLSMQTEKIIKEPPLSYAEIFRYSLFSRKIVVDEARDAFIREGLAKAVVKPFLIMTIVSLLSVVNFYVLYSVYSDTTINLWLIGMIILHPIAITVALMMSKLSKKNELTQLRVFFLLLPSAVGTAVVWPWLPGLSSDIGSPAGFMGIAVCTGVACVAVVWLYAQFWLSTIYTMIFTFSLSWNVYSKLDVVELANFLNVAFCLLLFALEYFLFISTVRAVNNEYRLLLQTKQLNDFFEEFQISNADWTWETDANNKITDLSASFSVVHPSARVDLFGISLTEIFAEDDMNTKSLENYLRWNQGFKHLILSPNAMLSKNVERSLTWELRGKPEFTHDGEFKGFRGFGRDVTDTYALQRLRHSREKFEIVSRFIAKVSHDFNNSLMILQANVDLLRLFKVPETVPDSAEILDQIDELTQSTSEVNNELLAYARQEFLRPDHLNLSVLLTSEFKKFSASFPDIRFLSDVEADVMSYLDKTAFSRALVNVLRNAAQAMDNHGKLSVTLIYHDAGTGGRSEIIIEDTGDGFSEQALVCATEPFFTTKRHLDGHGLGLATVDGFVRQSGGQLRIENTDMGARVTMTLPAQLGMATSEDKRIETVPVDPKKLKVLVVDDDVKILNGLQRQLTVLGIKTAVCDGSPENVESLFASGSFFDIGLFDLNLGFGDNDGFELSKNIAPIFGAAIFMTGYSDLSKSLQNQHVLRKPFALQTFLDMCSRALSEQLIKEEKLKQKHPDDAAREDDKIVS